MKKKILYILVIVLVLALCIFGFSKLFTKTEFTNFNTYEALPKSSALVLDIKETKNLLSELKTNNGIYKNILEFSPINSGNSLLHFIDSLNNLNPQKINFINKQSVLAFCIDGIKISQLCVINIPNSEKSKKYHQSLCEDLQEFGKIKSRTFHDTEIIEFVTKKNNQKLHFCTKNNLLILSFSSKLVEEAVKLLNNPGESLLQDKKFMQLHSTAGKKEIANIYIQMQNFSNLFSGYLNSGKNTEINNLKYYSDWTELDLSFTNDRINLNGFITKNDSIINFVNVLESQYPTNISSLQVLPNTTSLYTTFAFNDWEKYDKRLTAYLDQTGYNKNRINKIENIEKSSGINVKNTFYPMIENEICFALTNIIPDDIYSNSFTIFKVNSQSATIQELNDIIKKISEKTNKPISTYQDVLKIDQNTSIECFIFPFEGIPELLFGTMFKNCTGKYVCCIKNFVIFANTKESLLKFVYDALLNNTLKTSIEHNSFLENFSEKSNMFTYFSFYKGFEFFNNLFSEKININLSENSEPVYRLGNLGYQINKSGERLYNNIVIKHAENIEIKSQTLWESRLDSLVNIKPTIVTNHNDNSKEIIVQDAQNILYLLSSSGRVIWKIKLNEPIISNIFQIDFYKNNKYQYLFSTKSEIHIIDRLGNYLTKYPLKLRETATAPIELFDYDNDKKYRIAIPCENKKVYLYDLEGDIIKGWEFEGSENIVTSQINHYRIKGEDFIVFNDDYKAYFLSRKGETKKTYNTKFKFSKNNKIYLDLSSKNPRFVTTTEKGTIIFFYPDGKLDSLSVKGFSPEHHFAIRDIDRDGINDFIFTDGKRLDVYNNSKKLLLTYDFDSEISYPPSFYNFPNNKVKIGIVTRDIGKIYLINNDGGLFEGFPLHGLTQFSISSLQEKDDKFNLIVGGSDNLLYNYEIKY